jgi:hypothetical protein
VRITKHAAIVSLYRYEERMNGYVLLTLYSVHVYLALELVLAAAARALVGLELEPRFDRPYLLALLRDFWSRRWNLSIPALLRQRVFRPMCDHPSCVAHHPSATVHAPCSVKNAAASPVGGSSVT